MSRGALPGRSAGDPLAIAIVGAGVAGLCSAKVLKQFGFDVVVFDRTPDVGGVWSVTRRYPGVTTQNNKGTYAFSDFPMPREYPEWPTGEQVQRYLAGYADHFELGPHLRLGTEVTDAVQDPDTGLWSITSRDVVTGRTEVGRYDRVVVANGIFCDPFVPPYPGAAEYEQAGGRLCAASDFHDLADAADKNVLVVGYGKSACDVAEALSEVSATMTVVAREVTWKMPRKLGNVLNYKYVLLTRLSEGLFEHIEQRGFGRFLIGRGRFLRNALLGAVQRIAQRQLLLDRAGLVPSGSFERIVRHAVSLATEQFYEKVVAGTIAVRRGTVITALHEKDGRPVAELSDGSVLPADVVVCATGFEQRVPFMTDELQQRLTDADGNFLLYRQILPLDVPNLYFVGYGSSLFSPLSAEAAALWTANHMMGGAQLPPLEQRREFVRTRLDWMIERSEGKPARGTNIIPFSLRQIDEVLDEIDANVGPVTRLAQWFLPARPASYRRSTRVLMRRHGVGRR
ncbi:flavin-containing monooxygenase [Prescottella equi]|uniref:flavin-containing monooxygenase n=1 Tax=Rhodococcus hoagii TaxID=43767 RepID=UPI0009BFBB0C|nr:NAD(P)/FAD-dependent oxidoreductase [Prescottella equi]MBM4589513.1 NAD(P)-binding domain-containing protein [Prescottella equi]MBM4635047.1 NAD(P)-binding domain-containing protein [Prescottella equi]MBM4693824.1 NAD(P)-binding domain-containing protein [Prescottella equi]MBM4726254.1 NAD(P)-binding domain-containing protein [Prescottella equi]NKR93551.1 NAD(P)-binding domain-containing protein [Prescottella equi]